MELPKTFKKNFLHSAFFVPGMLLHAFVENVPVTE